MKITKNPETKARNDGLEIYSSTNVTVSARLAREVR